MGQQCQQAIEDERVWMMVEEQHLRWHITAEVLDDRMDWVCHAKRLMERHALQQGAGPFDAFLTGLEVLTRCDIWDDEERAAQALWLIHDSQVLAQSEMRSRKRQLAEERWGWNDVISLHQVLWILLEVFALVTAPPPPSQVRVTLTRFNQVWHRE